MEAWRYDLASGRGGAAGPRWVPWRNGIARDGIAPDGIAPDGIAPDGIAPDRA